MPDDTIISAPKSVYWGLRKAVDYTIYVLIPVALVYTLLSLSGAVYPTFLIPLGFFLWTFLVLSAGIFVTGFYVTKHVFLCRDCKHGLRWHEDRAGSVFPHCKFKKCSCSAYKGGK